MPPGKKPSGEISWTYYPKTNDCNISKYYVALTTVKFVHLIRVSTLFFERVV